MMGINQGYTQGYDQGCSKIDQQCVHGDIGGIASQFLGNHSGGGSGGADEAQHGTFCHHGSSCAHGQEMKGQRGHDKQAALEQQQPPMRTAQTQTAYVGLAKGKEQHAEDEQGLKGFNGGGGSMADGSRQGEGGIYEIGYDSANDSYGQSPVFEKGAH